jgi:molybdopterin molybdotransferase
MLSVAEALAQVTAGLAPLPAETVPLAEAAGRVLAQDLAARLTQPPFPASSMDGYAVRAADVMQLPARLTLLGEAAAGHPFAGSLGPGQTVRIFTGAAVPDGADLVVIQENARREGDGVEVFALSGEPFIRAAGSDFAEGQALLRAGHRLRPRDLLLAAQMNHAALSVRRRPKVAILASGDELVAPGQQPGPGQIVSSIPVALAAMIRQAGGDPHPVGIARDSKDSLAACIAAAEGADILLTIGGASVGDHDLVRAALEEAGFAIGFHKVAMRPGKPLMHGQRGAARVLGLPGNPVSAVLCTAIFLVPMLARLLGRDAAGAARRPARLAVALEANGPREHYMRARFTGEAANGPEVAPLSSQDSSLVTILAAADCLIIRPPHAPAAPPGETVEILPLDF